MRTYTRVFTDPNVLKEMLELRAGGRGYSSLARRYKVDHSSIMYQCNKYEIKKYKLPDRLQEKIKEKNTTVIYPSQIKIGHFVPPINRKQDKYADLLYEKINRGKNYFEYLKKEETKAVKRKFFNIKYYKNKDL